MSSLSATDSANSPKLSLVLADNDFTLMNRIKSANGDINEIRFLLKGNLDTCYRLFNDAVKKKDAIAQIQLSYARFGIEWGDDSEKDFSSLSSRDLKVFKYYPRRFELYIQMFQEATNIKICDSKKEKKAIEVYSIASREGYTPAFLELMCAEWEDNANSYGFALKLRPFVGLGDKWLDYYFGKALKNGSSIGSEIYYEGLYWMEFSCGVPVRYPEDDNFHDFKWYYLSNEYKDVPFYELDGFIHVGTSDVLVPSKEAWDNFVRDKFKNVRIISLDSYKFACNLRKIKNLIQNNRIIFSQEVRFIEHSEGKEVTSWDGKIMNGFFISSICISHEGSEVERKISVREDTFEIYETILDQKIIELIEFIENIMTRSGSAKSAESWLNQITKSN